MTHKAARMFESGGGFMRVADKGTGTFVGTAYDPEVAGWSTAADCVLDSTRAVESFLDGVAR